MKEGAGLAHRCRWESPSPGTPPRSSADWQLCPDQLPFNVYPALERRHRQIAEGIWL